MSRLQKLSDAQWSLIEGMLPRPTGREGRPFADARLMAEGILLARDPRSPPPRGIRAVIPEPDDQRGHRQRRGSRGGGPVGLGGGD